jgi:hypothetical protein
MNRLKIKFWELDIWTNPWAIFDTFFFSVNTLGVLNGTFTFVKQLQNASEWTNPVTILKGHVRPYRGVRAALEDIWNTKQSSFLAWPLPTFAY